MAPDAIWFSVTFDEHREERLRDALDIFQVGEETFNVHLLANDITK